jgi:hypothetical protein
MTKQPYARSDQRAGLLKVSNHENVQPITDSNTNSSGVHIFVVAKASLEQPWTGADMSRDGTLIAVRSEERVFFYSRDVESGQSIADAMEQSPCPFISETFQDGINQRQFEAVAFMDGGKE